LIDYGRSLRRPHENKQKTQNERQNNSFHYAFLLNHPSNEKYLGGISTKRKKTQNERQDYSFHHIPPEVTYTQYSFEPTQIMDKACGVPRLGLTAAKRLRRIL
jgi:hypothetical protein